ncbi:MAG: NAD(+)/NADH kinase [Candidatus Nezhaarchaeales archaeon]
MKLGLMSRTDSKEALEIVKQAIRLLSRRGIQYVIERNTAIELGLEGVAIENTDVNAILAIGGDGTILRLIRRLKKPVPILGVKFGKICFLGEIEPKDLDEAIERLIESKFSVEEVMKLTAKVKDGIEADAVNEVVVVGSQPAKVVELRTLVEGVEVYSGLADGIIVATPIGSTGYALSAHGPVINPAIEAMLLVPLNPLSLSCRPLVVPAEVVIEIKVGRPGGVVVVDGDLVGNLKEGDWIKVYRSPRKAAFIRFGDKRIGFYERLKGLFEVRARIRGI